MVSVPVRSFFPVCLDTLNVTVPSPLPAAPVSTVIQEAFDVEVHGQPAGTVTAMGSLVAALAPKV